jgi:branched-chain amino acid transport system ATP-binding protein
MLTVTELETGYGRKPVLWDVSMTVLTGQIAAVIGPNGAGKSTLLKAICGLVPPWRGEIRLGDVRTDTNTPAANFGLGMVYAPQGGRPFAGLTALENLELGGYHLGGRELRARVQAVLSLFPCLRDRLRQEASILSGGEQQMLSLARVLVSRPQVLLLDEPSLGLSPALVNAVFDKIAEISRSLSITVLLVEQRVHQALAISHMVYALKLGRLVFAAPPQDLADDRGRLKVIFL